MRHLRERYARLIGRFELMRELALILNQKRIRRGAIDFDMPEPLIEFDEFGEMAGVTRSPRNIAHRLIEEFMLSANEAVASHLEQAGNRIDLPHSRKARSEARDGVRRDRDAFRIFAGHRRGAGEEAFEPPMRRRDGKMVRNAKSCSPDDSLSISSRNYQKLIAQIEGKPEERILSYLMLRSLEAGALQRGKSRAFRAGRDQLHAFHLAHPPLSRPDRASALGRMRWTASAILMRPNAWS